MNNGKVIVSIHLDDEVYRVGTLWFHVHKGREGASFEYDDSWLIHPERFTLEPALQLTKGAFHTGNDVRLFGAMGDSAPDYWGRILMRRAEAMRARQANETPRTLLEMNYLLGVYDEARQGALHFSFENEKDVYLATSDKTAIPPLVDLHKLLSATQHFIDDSESDNDLRLLLMPGSSLGGARPKASVRDATGQLAIAKFPRNDDDFNTVVWEAVALTLAKQAGIRVSQWSLKQVLDQSVLIVQRFDRKAEQRVPFLSAMSMLSANDNEQHSYLEIADALAQHGASPEEDMKELWRRIVFTVMIANTDDHLRNHGFIYERRKGWRLSPAYDLNPTPIEKKHRILKTAIDLDDTSANLDTAMTVANHFRLSANQAKAIIQDVSRAVSGWHELAINHGLSKRECDRMASAFEYEKIR